MTSNQERMAKEAIEALKADRCAADKRKLAAIVLEASINKLTDSVVEASIIPQLLEDIEEMEKALCIIRRLTATAGSTSTEIRVVCDKVLGLELDSEPAPISSDEVTKFFDCSERQNDR